MNIELTTEQQEYKEAHVWLIASGRTGRIFTQYAFTTEKKAKEFIPNIPNHDGFEKLDEGYYAFPIGLL